MARRSTWNILGLVLILAGPAWAVCDSADGTTLVSLEAAQQPGGNLQATVITDCPVAPMLIRYTFRDDDAQATYYPPVAVSGVNATLLAYAFHPVWKAKPNESVYVLLGNRSVHAPCRYVGWHSSALWCSAVEFFGPRQ